MRVAVVLPAYNEALTIERTIEDFFSVLPDAHFVVVDNASNDGTGALARAKLIALNAKGQVFTEPRRGKGRAIRAAFSTVDADIFLLADADLTYPAKHAAELIAPVQAGQADMVVGDRHSGGHYQDQNKRHLHGFGNGLVLRLINFLFGANLRDILSGYRAFSRQFVKSYPILVDGFEIETDMTLHALDKRFRILEVSVEYQDRPAGSTSKLSTFTDGARVLFTIFSILRYYRPLLFFGVLSVVFGLVGIVASLPVFNDWIVHRFIYHVPLALLAVAFELIAALSLSVGLVLDSITHQYQMSFERQLLRDPR